MARDPRRGSTSSPPNFGHMERQPPAAPERAMTSEHQAFAGSAEGIGSIDYDDPGAFDVTAADVRLAGAAARPQGQGPAPRPDSGLDPDAGAPAPNVTGTGSRVDKTG